MENKESLSHVHSFIQNRKYYVITLTLLCAIVPFCSIFPLLESVTIPLFVLNHDITIFNM